jgi:hypothetical protein
MFDRLTSLASSVRLPSRSAALKALALAAVAAFAYAAAIVTVRAIATRTTDSAIVLCSATVASVAFVVELRKQASIVVPVAASTGHPEPLIGELAMAKIKAQLETEPIATAKYLDTSETAFKPTSPFHT